MNSILEWLRETSVAGSAAIVMIVLVSPVLRKFFGARAAQTAWLFALVLLVSPWPVRSPASVLPAAAGTLPETVVRIVIPASGPATIPASIETIATPFPWLLAIWATGSATLLAITMLRAFRTWRVARRSVEITEALHPHLESLGAAARGIRVFESSTASGPAVVGLFRPVVLLPTGWVSNTDSETLRWILLHEAGHIRRGDLVWRWAFQFVTVIHWFNPLVWLAGRVSSIHQEMACDEWVLRQSDSEADGYGEAILQIAKRSSSRAHPAMFQVGMAEPRHGLSRRIIHLATANPRGAWATIAMLALGTAALALLSPHARATTPDKVTIPDQSRSLKQIEIKTRFVELSPAIAEEFFGKDTSNPQTILFEKEFLALSARLSSLREGVSLLHAPKVTVKPGSKASVQVTREFVYPTEYTAPTKTGDIVVPTTPSQFTTRDVGVTLEIEPALSEEDDIICTMTARAVEFLGFVDYRDGPPTVEKGGDSITAAIRPAANPGGAFNQPIFETREIQSAALLKSGQTILFGGLQRQGNALALDPTAASANQSGASDKTPRILYLLVSASLVDAPADATSTPATSTPAAASSPGTSAPVAKPVEGRPGFVTSPWAPDKGYIDVRGFESGTEVKCPYTQKIFLVP